MSTRSDLAMSSARRAGFLRALGTIFYWMILRAVGAWGLIGCDELPEVLVIELTSFVASPTRPRAVLLARGPAPVRALSLRPPPARRPQGSRRPAAWRADPGRCGRRSAAPSVPRVRRESDRAQIQELADATGQGAAR